MNGARSCRINALTDLWTGDVERKPARLISTGLLGSIRWWFEVVVRGLAGRACDPSRHQCPDPRRKPVEAGHHCVVCELFGCTGWARKFRFDVLDSGGAAQKKQIKKGAVFQLRFTPLRPIGEAEWALLDLTLRFIAGHAALGGKTVYKPSVEASRGELAHHRDCGLVAVEEALGATPMDRKHLETYVRGAGWRRVDHGTFAWASLQSFWCVHGRYLARQDRDRSTFNRVIGRPENKNKRRSSGNDSWLAGRRAGGGRQAESKKVFSFKDPPRTFGFTDGGRFDLRAVKRRLRQAWEGLRDEEVRTGDVLLEEILSRPRIEGGR